VTEEDYNKWFHELTTTKADDCTKYLYGNIFLPNLEKGPAVVLFGSHTRCDGYSWVSVWYELSDSADKFKKRNYFAEAIDRFFATFYTIASIPYARLWYNAPPRMYGRPTAHYLNHQIGIVV
jgi:hypothetical protein